ncbi:MAG: FAD-dependent oxidoreductase [Christensenellales bacterium]|jgi:hypothetical protein
MHQVIQTESSVLVSEKIPVKASYDVIVVGGGVAGVAAAMAAARRGKSVLLMEKSIMLGGLATLGFVVGYLPLCDGNGRKLIGGISEEMLWASITHSYDTLPEAWRAKPDSIDGSQRYQTLFNGPLFAMRLDRMLLESGAHVMFDSLFCGVIREEDRASHVIVQNLDGRVAYACNTVVDASGDAGVFHQMGAETVLGNNYTSYWGYYTDMDAIRKAAKKGEVAPAVKLYTGGADCNGKGHPPDMRIIHGVSAEDVNDMVLRGREEALHYLEQHPANSMAFTGLPGMPQFRTTRMISGDYALRYADSGAHFEDSIGCCGDWREAGIPFEIPYRILTAPSIKNVLAAGRNISCADREAWEVTRVIPVAAQTGEAAGIAATLSNGQDVHDVDAKAIAHEMARSGNCVRL